MSHEFESGFTVREPAWHKLGKVVPEEVYSAAEALTHAGCDWTVSLRDMFIQADSVSSIKVPNRKAVVRDTDNRILGVVSNRYTPLQNKDAFEFFNPFVHEKDCYYDTAGSLRNGSVIWVLAKINGTTEDVVKDDPICRYLLLATSHDCSVPLSVRFTDVRVVCQNTLQMALNGTNNTLRQVRVRHSASIHEKLSSIQSRIDLAKADFHTFADSMRFLQSQEMSTNDLRNYLERLFEKELDVAREEREDAQLEDIRGAVKIIENFESTPDLQTPNVKGTWYAGFQAVTEYVTWQKSSNQDTRLNSIWFGPDATFLSKAKDTALALAR